ncbi:MAG: hypothetical protein PVSMB1_16420 [Gemmatimonadaceae bacterium]
MIRHVLLSRLNSTMLSIAIHAMIIVALIVYATSSRITAGSKGLVEGAGDGKGGMLATHVRNRHSFKVVDAETREPVVGAEVRDALGDTAALSSSDGLASLSVRPGARLLLRVSEARHETVTLQVANLVRDTLTRVIALKSKSSPGRRRND